MKNVKNKKTQNLNILGKYYRIGNLNHTITNKFNESLTEPNNSQNKNNKLKLNFTCSNLFPNLKKTSINCQKNKNIPNLSLSICEKESRANSKNSQIVSFKNPKPSKSKNELIIKKIQIHPIVLNSVKKLPKDLTVIKSGN